MVLGSWKLVGGSGESWTDKSWLVGGWLVEVVLVGVCRKELRVGNGGNGMAVENGSEEECDY